VKQENFIIMKKLPKLEACSSLCQTKGSVVENSDKISDLPVHIAHHMLSFLSMEDIARLSTVSKWWQELCLSIPSLTLNGMQYIAEGVKLIYFKNFVDRLMLRRNGMKMVQFCIHWAFLDYHYEEYRFLTWLHDAVRCKVEVLYLELCIRSFRMPLCVVHCELLRFLTLNLHGGVLQLPSSSGFKKLKSLSLERVQVLDELFLERVLSSCYSLDKLCLDDISGTKNINIRSSSLKYFEFRGYGRSFLFHLNVSGELLEELKIHWRFLPSYGKSLKITTPNLKWFTWDGFAPDNCFLGNLKCLRSCTLNLEQLSSSWRLPSLEYFQFLEGINDLEIQFRCLKVNYRIIFNSYLLQLWGSILILRTCFEVKSLRKYDFFIPTFY